MGGGGGGGGGGAAGNEITWTNSERLQICLS